MKLLYSALPIKYCIYVLILYVQGLKYSFCVFNVLVMSFFLFQRVAVKKNVCIMINN